MACIKYCYFLKKSYVESEPGESYGELEGVDNESNESDTDSDKLNYLNKFAYCNFDA
jgi:hypothetical protein